MKTLFKKQQPSAFTLPKGGVGGGLGFLLLILLTLMGVGKSFACASTLPLGGDGGGLTLERVRQLALENEASITIAERQMQQQELQKKVAATYHLPSISAMGGATYQANALSEQMTAEVGIPAELGLPISSLQSNIPLNVSLNGAYLAGVQLNQTIYAGGKVRSSNQMAELGVAIASENKRMQEVNTIVEADQAYWTFVAVQSKVQLAEKNVTLLETLVKRVGDSYEVGYTNQNDLLKVRVKHNQAKLDLKRAQNGLELCRMSLCRLIGFPLDTPIETDSILYIDTELLVELSGEDVSQRPEYQILEKQIQLADTKIKHTRADHLPQLAVTANYGTWGGVEMNNMDLSNTGFSALAMLKVPLFNWGRGQKEIQMAELDKEMRTAELNKNSQLMLLEISKARFALEEAALTISICTDNLAQAEENQRVSADSYELGKETISDLLVAQTQRQEAENELLEAKVNFKLAETEYLRTMGRVEN
ncbi:MAG: TolC family protein [Mangrovibacterium sp.]